MEMWREYTLAQQGTCNHIPQRTWLDRKGVLGVNLTVLGSETQSKADTVDRYIPRSGDENRPSGAYVTVVPGRGPAPPVYTSVDFARRSTISALHSISAALSSLTIVPLAALTPTSGTFTSTSACSAGAMAPIAPSTLAAAGTVRLVCAAPATLLSPPFYYPFLLANSLYGCQLI